MNAVAKLMDLLRRPLVAQPDDKRKKLPPDQVPATEAELIAAIEDAKAERWRAQEVIASADEQREALLLQPDSDEAIFAIDREVRSAELTLERLNRIEPELHEALDVVQRERVMARAVVLRDEFVAKAREHVPHMMKFLILQGHLSAAAKAILEEFPGVRPHLPALPSISEVLQFVEFIQKVELFATFDYDPRRLTHARNRPHASLEVANRAFESGQIGADEITNLFRVWGIDANSDGQEKVRFRSFGHLDSGERFSPGQVVTLSHDEAYKHRAAGRCEFLED